MRGIWGTGAATLLIAASSSAFAADLPARPPPMLPLPVYNWTGFYIGGNLGGAWASGSLHDNLTGASLTGNNSGFIGGGQLGYNWQVSPQFVLGLEWMFDGTAIRNSASQVVVLGDTIQGSSKIDWVTTLTGRLGYASNNWLFYVKGGGGWAESHATVNDLTTGLSASGSNNNSGWVAGAGIEYGLTPNWTMKAEWQYLGLRNFTVGSPIAGDNFTWKPQINMFTVGVNYKF